MKIRIELVILKTVPIRTELNEYIMITSPSKYKYEIYIGSNDKDNLSTVFDVDEIAKTIGNIYNTYSIAFSLNKIEGGYRMENGAYIKESSICITCITNVDFEVLKITFNIIKEEFNQEHIMIVRTLVKERIYE